MKVKKSTIQELQKEVFIRIMSLHSEYIEIPSGNKEQGDFFEKVYIFNYSLYIHFINVWMRRKQFRR